MPFRRHALCMQQYRNMHCLLQRFSCHPALRGEHQQLYKCLSAAAVMAQGDATGLPQSIFVSDDAPVYEIPIREIARPIPSVLDEKKVEAFMSAMQVTHVWPCTPIARHARHAACTLRQ